ncbi:IS4 family transposase [Ramlibacter humi]|uniref:IS4 family transposase n=1 Tax=Ramlibacter humi TaxID=2530451 RepID=A0A4Z0BZY9_9BURK|nr:IS4 family transposase [Ramlibacter humi]TFZ03878.1 IS4 family transposase [Ramlibacter humi]
MFSISRIHQVLQAIPRGAFDRIVQQHGADRYGKGFGSWQHLVAMVYAQVSGASSLRQLEASFNALPGQHYHLHAKAVRRSTLADANARREPQVFAQLLELLMAQAGRSVRSQREELRYLLDATNVPLAYRGERVNARIQPGLKLHVVLDAASAGLAHARLTGSRVDDKTEARKLPVQAGATYVFDRGYCDYNWWASLHDRQARFVTRLRRNAAVTTLQELVPTGPAIVGDSIVAFALRKPRGGHCNSYSTPLRRIRVSRPDAAELVLITNDLSSPAQQIAELYKQRWQIELLFKWIKQHLQIRRFLGRGDNAARIQVLTALIAYMLVLLLKVRSGFTGTLWMLLAQLRSGLFQRPQTDNSYWRRRQLLREHIACVQGSLL